MTVEPKPNKPPVAAHGAALLSPPSTSAAPVPNRQDIVEFFTRTIRDQIHLVAIDPKSPKIVGYDFGTDIADAVSWAITENMGGMNVYFSVNRVSSGQHKKATKADICAIRFAHVDIDPPKDRSEWSIATARSSLEGSEHPPSSIIFSGGGLNAMWRVEDANTDVIEQVNKGLIAKFSGDSGVWNADRILRLPGTVNWPDKRKLARGRVPTLSRIDRADTGASYRAVKLAEAFPAPAERKTKMPAVPAADLSDCTLLTADDLSLASNDFLRRLIDKPQGDDRSADVYAVACEMGRQGYTLEKMVGILLHPDNAVSAHCLDQDDPRRAAMKAIANASNEDDVARRKAQRVANRHIGDGSDLVPKSEIFSLPDMLERFVFIKDGSQVADLTQPQAVRLLNDFRNTVAGSKHKIIASNGAPKFVPASSAWLESDNRLEAETLTFHAGVGRMTVSPSQGLRALNLWSPLVRNTPPSDWAARAEPFISHLRWLWGDEVEVFLDWLAHIEQQPGVLPHFGWVHISRIHGKGRNWIAGVLSRLWRGNVAASLDLMGVLEGGFNDRLSRCLLAIVDEINEGGNQSYRHAQTLRQIVTAEVREINPKYGRRHLEYNTTRWLMYSNHTAAIPLGKEDRRFYVVDHDGPARDGGYYQRLYALLDDPVFLASVAEFLRTRDISTFNVGQRPRVTKAKEALMALTQSEDDGRLTELVAHWPVDVITAREINEHLDHGGVKYTSVRHAMDRAGIRKLFKVRTGETSEVVYALRNYERWFACAHEKLKAEIHRKSPGEKQAALDADLHGCSDLV